MIQLKIKIFHVIDVSDNWVQRHLEPILYKRCAACSSSTCTSCIYEVIWDLWFWHFKQTGKFIDRGFLFPKVFMIRLLTWAVSSICVFCTTHVPTVLRKPYPFSCIMLDFWYISSCPSYLSSFPLLEQIHIASIPFRIVCIPSIDVAPPEGPLSRPF